MAPRTRNSSLGFRSDARRALGAFVAVALLLLLGALALAYWLGPPLPPRQVTIAGATPGSPYDIVVRQYGGRLSVSGVEVKVAHSGGTEDNLALLRDAASGVSAALASTGGQRRGDEAVLESLGGMFLSALFVFVRADMPVERIADLKGRRISMGPPGFYSKIFAYRMLEMGGVDPGNSDLRVHGSEAALDAVIGGDLDVAIVPGTLETGSIRRGLSRTDLRMAHLVQADAISKRIPELTRVTLPRGAFDLAADRPPADVVTVAAVNSLIVRKDLHPAIQYLLLEAARDVHGPPGVFNRLGEFPAETARDLPLSAEAERFYRSGKPWLQKYTSFWAAVMIDRAVVILVPLLAVLVPVVRFLPMLYVSYYRRRLARWSRELRQLVADGGAGGDVDARRERLRALVDEIDAHRMPASLELDAGQLRERAAALGAQLANSGS